MSVRTGVIIGALIILSIAVALYVVTTIQLNDAMPSIVKTAEAITNATLIATIRAKGT